MADDNNATGTDRPAQRGATGYLSSPLDLPEPGCVRGLALAVECPVPELDAGQTVRPHALSGGRLVMGAGVVHDVLRR